MEIFHGDKVGHFTIAIVFKSDCLSVAMLRHYLPQGPTYINQSDKRDTMTAFLSVRPQCGHKRALVDSKFQQGFFVCVCEDWTFFFLAGGSYSLLTSAKEQRCYDLIIVWQQGIK